jgi:hypothetical protein
MKHFAWIFIFAMVLLAGCSPKTNDGITPTQPSYTGGNLPDPFLIYNGSLAAGIGVTVFLPPPYTAPVNVNLTDTSITPISGNASMSFGLSSFNPGGNASSPTGYWASFLLIPNPQNGIPVTVNLSGDGFSQATFYSKFVGAAGVTTMPIGFGAANGTATLNLTNNWVSYSVPLGSLTAVNNFLSVGFANNTDSAPLTVYVDDLVYQ